MKLCDFEGVRDLDSGTAGTERSANGQTTWKKSQRGGSRATERRTSLSAVRADGRSEGKGRRQVGVRMTYVEDEQRPIIFGADVI